MTITHTPAHTISVPDRLDDDVTGAGYSIFQDDSAEDPRTWVDDEHAAVYTFRAPHGATDEVPENIAAQAFARYWQETGDAERSLVLARRYMLAFHPEAKYAMAVETVRGYSQSDWWDVFAAVEEGHGSPDGHIGTFKTWAVGDVWIVSEDGGDSLSGIYADDIEAALQVFLEQFAPAMPSPTEPAAG